MRADIKPPEIGTEWAYRVGDTPPSQRVRVLSVTPKKNSFRVDVEFLEGAQAGQKENVPGSRLRVPWSRVQPFDELMANWDRLAEYDIDEIEEDAIEAVYDLLLPTEVATWEWKPIRFGTAVHDKEALAALMKASIDEIAASVASFDLDGVLMLSCEGSLLIAEDLCRTHPMRVLDKVVEEEDLARQKCKRGFQRTDLIERRDVSTSPEWEYDRYRERLKPLHELLRQWCGHRAVTFQQRLTAAEAEVHRLDVIVASLIDVMKDETYQGGVMFAKSIEEEHERDRITALTVRPVVERPLQPSEIPVHYVQRRRRWG
jgi:hypothetical protein